MEITYYRQVGYKMCLTYFPSLCCTVMPTSHDPGPSLIRARCLSSACYLYLQAKVLHPFLYGGGYCSLGLPQGRWALLTASQQTRVTGNVQSSSCNCHLGGQSGKQTTEGVRLLGRNTYPCIQSKMRQTDRKHGYMLLLLQCTLRVSFEARNYQLVVIYKPPANVSKREKARKLDPRQNLMDMHRIQWCYW